MVVCVGSGQCQVVSVGCSRAGVAADDAAEVVWSRLGMSPGVILRTIPGKLWGSY